MTLYSFVYDSCNQPCVLTIVCTDCDTEDYGLEILFLECWSRASELDFFEVQYNAHTVHTYVHLVQPFIVLPYVCIVCA